MGLLTPLREDERGVWLEKLIDVIQKQGLDSTTVEKSHVEKAAKVKHVLNVHLCPEILNLVMQECCQNEFEEQTELLNVISAFEIPKFIYNTERKKYLPHESQQGSGLSIFGTAKDKADMFRHRYALLHQRTSRHSLFTPSILGQPSSSSNTQKYQLKPIEYLLGMSTKLTDVVVLGMLAHLTEGKLYLEDPTGTVPISLKDTVLVHTSTY